MWKWETEGQAKAVIVLIHSAYEHHLRYAWQIEQWRSANFRVVMADLPGHGERAADMHAHKESFDDYEEAVELMMKMAAKEDLPVFVIAHGLGATVSMNVLGRLPFQAAGAVFTSPWLHLVKTPPKVSGAWGGLHKLAGNVKINHGIQIYQLTRNREIIIQEENDELYRPVITAGWYRELQSYLKQTSAGKGTFPDIPTFVHTGERDMITGKEQAKHWLKQQQLKEFSYKEWKNCYHDLFQEPERDDVFLSTHFFIKNVLRSLGYVVE